MLESLACADNILYACRGGGGFIRTEWVCNTPPSSFLIKLPSYCFMWVTARTRVLLEPRYQSWWKKRANWVKWIIWTHVCCPSQPFRANICINNVLFAIHLEKVECASQFHSRVWRVQTQVILYFYSVGFFVCGLVKLLLSRARTFTWKMAVDVTSHRCPVILNRAVLWLWYRSLKKMSRLLMRPLKWRILQLLILSRSIFLYRMMTQLGAFVVNNT